ncbi:MFS transporter [Chloroflexota bacterium]
MASILACLPLEERAMKAKDYVGMNVYWFGLAFMWNGLHPIILPALLLQFSPEALKNTYLGALTFAGLLLAMVVQPMAGARSDRTRSRWGRRRLWIVAGTALSLVVLVAMALAGSLWGLFVAYLLLQLASNMAHGPAQGLIPDLIPGERRGLASGIKNFFDMGGLVLTSLVAGYLMGAGNPVLAFTVIGAVLAVCATITVVTTREPSSLDLAPDAGEGQSGLFGLDLRRYPSYAWLLSSRFFILLGVYAVQGFAQYFIRDRLGVAEPAQVTGNLMATIGLALTLLVFPAGLLSDRFGRLRLNLIAGSMASLGILLLIFVQDVTTLYIFGAVVGMATGIFLSVNWALATDLVPPEEAGKYLGISNFATAGAAATSRLAGPLIDGLNALRPDQYLGYPALFVLASGSALLGTLLLLRTRR